MPTITKKLPFNFAKRHGVFLSDVNERSATIVHRANINSETIIELQRFLQKQLMLRAVSDSDFEQQLAKAYEAGSDAAMEAMTDIEEELDLTQLMNKLPRPEDLLESQDDAPVIRLLNAILTQAIKQNASDIHIETFEEAVTVRYRVDGVLRSVLQPPRALAPLLISRLKVMAKLDIAEKRLPQDGRISLRIAGRAVDVRVSTIPAHYGERIVLRLLDKQAAPLDLKKLGMSPTILKLMQELIAQPYGIILVTGPTGSGKTTTLYAGLTRLNDASRNILTIEDPIEYYLPGIGQTQVNAKIGMSFALGLRAILRQDPDVVMVGEIRDLETVKMAIQASLTGHLVLSTLHTNSALGAIARLRDMGAEPFLLSSSVIGMVAQRLVRLLCEHCKQLVPATPGEKKLMGTDETSEVMLARAAGCERCSQQGFSGRAGIYELIVVDEMLRTKIHDNVSETDMEKYVREQFPSMRYDGWQRVLAGETTIEEVLRVTAEE